MRLPDELQATILIAVLSAAALFAGVVLMDAEITCYLIGFLLGVFG